MKKRINAKPILALAVIVFCGQTGALVLAQNSNPAPVTVNPAPVSVEATVPASASEAPPVQLSAGVPEILKLRTAHTSDDVIIGFINSSGRKYPLSASEILYLREQGVSDQVLAAMLDSRPATSTSQPATTGPTHVWANSSPEPQPVPASTTPQYAPAYVAPPTYVQPSPVYVYPAPSYGYYGGGPYWGFPALSFSFGFGGHYGGYHGGGYHGGGGHH
jgi:hypothetical protein